jgi:hypothetical protein
MARIPLLLALMTEYASRNGTTLPNRRCELLEQYVAMILRPAKHKPAMIETDPLILRAAAERLAFASIDGNGDFDAHDATKDLPTDAQEILDSLVACGLTTEQGARYRFGLPLVQEYLSGCFFAKHRLNEVVSRFDANLSRPWAQTLQFAIERVEDADALARCILEASDDAFSTRLKTLGRCIANGARVSAGVRARVGEALGALWVQEDRAGSFVGELLADGFANPLPTNVRAQVATGAQLEFGGARILVAAADSELTLQTLTAALAVGFPGHVLAWQLAIDRVAPAAARLYLGRAKAIQTQYVAREIQWIAYLLAELAPVADPSDPRVDAATDPEQHPLIRLACMVRLGKAFEVADGALVGAALRELWATEVPGRMPPLELAFKALFMLPDAVNAWRCYLEEVETAKLYAEPTAWWLVGLSPQEAYWRSLVFAIVKAMQRQAIPHLRQLRLSVDVRGSRRDYIDLCLAFLDDSDAFSALSQRLEGLHERDISSWLVLLRRHPQEAVAAGLSRLAGIRKEDRVKVLVLLCFSLRYEIEIADLTGGARGLARALHPTASIAASLLCAWADESPLGSQERLLFLSGALQLGELQVAGMLETELLARLKQKRPLTFEMDRALADSLTALAEAGRSSALDVLLGAARASKWNLAHRAIDQIERSGTRAALDCLVALHNERDVTGRGLLRPQVERLALSLGQRVDRNALGEFVVAR